MCRLKLVAEFHVKESTFLAHSIFKTDEGGQVPGQTKTTAHVAFPASKSRATYVVENAASVAERRQHETEVLFPNYGFGEAPPQLPGSQRGHVADEPVAMVAPKRFPSPQACLELVEGQ